MVKQIENNFQSTSVMWTSELMSMLACRGFLVGVDGKFDEPRRSEPRSLDGVIALCFSFPLNNGCRCLSCTIFHSAFPSQIPSLFPLVPPCSNVSGRSVTPSPPVTTRHSLSLSVTLCHFPSRPVTLRHFPSFSVTSLYFPSSFTIFHLHCNLGYVPSSGYDPYPYQLSPPSSFSDLWL